MRKAGQYSAKVRAQPSGLLFWSRNPNVGHDAMPHSLPRYWRLPEARSEKLSILSEAGSIAGIKNWKEIKPDRYDDWIGQRERGVSGVPSNGFEGS